MPAHRNPSQHLGPEATLAPDLLAHIASLTCDAVNRETEPLRRRGRDRFLVGLLIFFLGLAVGALLIALPFLAGLRSTIP